MKLLKGPQPDTATWLFRLTSLVLTGGLLWLGVGNRVTSQDNNRMLHANRKLIFDLAERDRADMLTLIQARVNLWQQLQKDNPTLKVPRYEKPLGIFEPRPDPAP